MIILIAFKHNTSWALLRWRCLMCPTTGCFRFCHAGVSDACTPNVDGCAMERTFLIDGVLASAEVVRLTPYVYSKWRQCDFSWCLLRWRCCFIRPWLNSSMMWTSFRRFSWQKMCGPQHANNCKTHIWKIWKEIQKQTKYLQKWIVEVGLGCSSYEKHTFHETLRGLVW